MTDIEYITTDPWKPSKAILKVKYTFRNMPFLVADKFGNLFTLAHCPKRRTIPFKQLDKSKGYVYYRGNKIRVSTLKDRAIVSFDRCEVV
jgi:hypothetical protein